MESLEGRLLLTNRPYLYVASFGTNSIERFREADGAPAPAPGQSGATLVPSDTAGLNHPLGVLIGPRDGLLYVSNLETDQVFRFDPDTGEYIDAIVDGDPQVNAPAGIIFGPDRKLYVANTGNGKILRYDVTQPPGTPGELVLELMPLGVTGIVFGPDGRLYVNTRFNNGVMRCDVSYPGFEYCEDFVLDADGEHLQRSGGSVFGPDGDLYVTSQTNGRVLRYDGVTGEFVSEFVVGGEDVTEFRLLRPAGLIFGPDGNLYVTGANSNNITHFDGDTGTFLNEFVPASTARVSRPRGLFFGNSSATTLQYIPRSAPGGGGRPGPGGGVVAALTAGDAPARAQPVTIAPGGSTVVGQAPAPVGAADDLGRFFASADKQVADQLFATHREPPAWAPGLEFALFG